MAVGRNAHRKGNVMESAFYSPHSLFSGAPGVSPWMGGLVESAAKSDMGMVRESNQDSFGIEQDLGLYLVADGMGGRAGGEVASSIAVQTIVSEVRQKLPNLMSRNVSARGAALAQCINAASLRIYERSLELPQFRGMGTTTTLLWVNPDQGPQALFRDIALVAHVGDSRCYLLRAGFLYQVTDDHSLINEQIKSGTLKKNDPVIAQIRNVITRCVGYREEEEVDVIPVQLFSGDTFLLCSDGLTNKVTDREITNYLSQQNLQKAAQDLVDRANSAGGEDNITAVLIHFI